MRPRSSLLSLFDPLASEEPPRDAPSPDSDKENSLLSDFSFFGRPPKAPSPVRLKHRLVDVGDITIDDTTFHPMLTDEDELDDSMCDDENHTLTLRLPATTPTRNITAQQSTFSSVSLRTPLAELSLDHDITPMPRTKMYRRQVATSDAVIPASPESSTFASVIDLVTASGVSFADPVRSFSANQPGYKSQPADTMSYDNETPQITVTSIDELSNSESPPSLDTPPSTLLEDASEALTSLSLFEPSETSIEHPQISLRSSPPAFVQDKKRHSIDLSSTFQLQLQSEEASFDLLNDKISLFACTSSMDSFLDGLDEEISFDAPVKEAQLQATINSIDLEEGRENVHEVDDMHALKQEHRSIAVIASRSPSPHLPLTELMKHQEPSVYSKPSSPDPSESTEERNNECPEMPKEIVDEPSISLPVSCPPLHDETSAVLRTPAPNVREQASLPPPVPALRIVKRSVRPGHEKLASISIAASSASEGPVFPTTVTASVAPVAPISRPVSSADMNRVTNVRSATSSSSVTLLSTRTGDGTANGPRRVPVADSQPLTINKRRGFAADEQKTMPQGNTMGPRRVVVAPSVPVPPAAPVQAPSKASVSGLKAPTKYGVGTSTAVSALPRPVSRLPISAASGIVRPPRAGAGATTVGPGIVPTKRTTYSRRVV